MDTASFIIECMARAKANPSKTKAEIVTEVLQEIAAWKAAMAPRAEFGGTDNAATES